MYVLKYEDYDCYELVKLIELFYGSVIIIMYTQVIYSNPVVFYFFLKAYLEFFYEIRCCEQ